MRAIGVLAAAVLLLLPTGGSHAATQMETLLCRGGIVSRGDVQAQVLAKCGPPVFASQRDEVLFEHRVRSIAAIEEWTYNFGPNEFMYLVRFVNGRVARIESLDYGY